MKRVNAMSGEELRQYLTDQADNKRIKTDFLQEAIDLSVNSGFKDREELTRDLLDLRHRLVKFLKPAITVGPENSFFYFYVQGKKICIVTGNNIFYNRSDKEMLHFLETVAINMYPEVAYQKIYHELIQTGESPFNLRSLPDPNGLIYPTDFLPKFLGFLMGVEFG